MKNNFYDVIKNRRSYYSIGKEKTVSENRIKQVLSEAIKHAPSPFNSQSSRVVLLLNEQHDKLWEIVKDELRKIVPAANFEGTRKKIDNCFKSGYGTVLYFEDENKVKSLQKQFPLYKDNFPIWSNQASAILQYIVWSSLELEGLGASLQHYNPLIDSAVKKEWNIPEHYKLIAQMPFGKPLAHPGEKEFMPIEERLKVY